MTVLVHKTSTMMMEFPVVLVLLLATCSSAFLATKTTNKYDAVNYRFSQHQMANHKMEGDATISTSRRGFLHHTIGAAAAVMMMIPKSAFAIPMISVDEFGTILQESPYSVQVVECSGPKSETVTVKLVDGTSFGLKDIIESPTDPRSPLRVQAMCRENNVKSKFTDFEAILSTTPKKKKLYTNQRVQEAAEKEQAKRERMQQDEEERLAAVRKMEEEQK